MYGSDQAASIEPNGLRQLVGAVRKIEKALGNGKKDVTESEVPVAKKLREHIKEEEKNLVTVNQVGVMQGRLLPKYKGRYQAHPKDTWQDEFF